MPGPSNTRIAASSRFVVWSVLRCALPVRTATTSGYVCAPACAWNASAITPASVGLRPQPPLSGPPCRHIRPLHWTPSPPLRNSYSHYSNSALPPRPEGRVPRMPTIGGYCHVFEASINPGHRLNDREPGYLLID